MTDKQGAPTYSKDFLSQYATAKEAEGQTLLQGESSPTSQLASSIVREAIEKLEKDKVLSDTVKCSRQALERAIGLIKARKLEQYVDPTIDVGSEWTNQIMTDIDINLASTSETIREQLIAQDLLPEEEPSKQNPLLY